MYDLALNASTDSGEIPTDKNTPTEGRDERLGNTDDGSSPRRSRGKAMHQELQKLRKLVLKQAEEIETLKDENNDASNAVQDVMEEVADLTAQLDLERSKNDVLVSQAEILTRERDDIAECLDQKIEAKAAAHSSCTTCSEYDAKYHSLSVRFKLVCQEKERLATDLSRIRSERDELLQTIFRSNERNKRMEERVQKLNEALHAAPSHGKKIKPPLPPKATPFSPKGGDLPSPMRAFSCTAMAKVDMLKTADLAIPEDEGDDTTVDTNSSFEKSKQFFPSPRNSLVQSQPPDLGTLPMRGRSTRRPLRKGQDDEEETECFIPDTWDQTEDGESSGIPDPITPLGFRLGRKRYQNGNSSSATASTGSPRMHVSVRPPRMTVRTTTAP